LLTALGVGDGTFGFEAVFAGLFQFVQMSPQTGHQGAILHFFRVELLRRNHFADMKPHHFRTVFEQLVRQQHGTGGLPHHRCAVEQQRIACLHQYGQQGCFCLAGKMQEAGTPQRITDAKRAGARDFASGKHDNGAFFFKFGQHIAIAAQRTAAAHVVDRDQQVIKCGEITEQVVGDDLDVAAYFAHQLQQGKAIE